MPDGADLARTPWCGACRSTRRRRCRVTPARCASRVEKWFPSRSMPATVPYPHARRAGCPQPPHLVDATRRVRPGPHGVLRQL